jgi:hypothetical protein
MTPMKRNYSSSNSKQIKSTVSNCKWKASRKDENRKHLNLARIRRFGKLSAAVLYLRERSNGGTFRLALFATDRAQVETSKKKIKWKKEYLVATSARLFGFCQRFGSEVKSILVEQSTTAATGFHEFVTTTRQIQIQQGIQLDEVVSVDGPCSLHLK